MIVLGLFKSQPKHEISPSAREFYSYLNKRKIDYCTSKIEYFNKEKGYFNRAYFFEKGQWVERLNVIPDKIYDKSSFFIDKKNQKIRRYMEKNFHFVNGLKLTELLSDKWKTYKFIRQYCPKTVLIEKIEDFSKIEQILSDEIIYKPISGSKGRGIFKVKKANIPKLKGRFVAQELISMKNGVPGIVKGMHDLRIMIANGKIFHSFVRAPRKGEFISNFARGGRVIYVPFDKIPKGVIAISKEIEKSLVAFGDRLYTIDFMIDDNQKPWVIEMNSHPALLLEKDEEKNKKKYYSAIASFLNNKN